MNPVSEIHTLVKMIGSPLVGQQSEWSPSPDSDLKNLYEFAFENRK